MIRPGVIPLDKLEYLADFTENASWELYDEDGGLLSNFSTNNHCAKNQTFDVILATTDFEAWISLTILFLRSYELRLGLWDSECFEMFFYP